VYLPGCHYTNNSFVPGQLKWHLWPPIWQWFRFLSLYFMFSLSFPIDECVVFTFRVHRNRSILATDRFMTWNSSLTIRWRA
jgi:hypothetical protein